MKYGVLFTALLCISGCAHVPLSGIYRLYELDPTDLDPHNTKVAVKSPKAIRIGSDDVVLRVKRSQISGADSNAKIFSLSVIDNPNIPGSISYEVGSEENLSIFKVLSSDVERLRKTQSEIRHHVANGGSERDYKFGVTVTGGCRTSTQIPIELPVSIYLKTDRDSSYFAMLKNYDFLEADLSPYKNVRDWDLCQG